MKYALIVLSLICSLQLQAAEKELYKISLKDGRDITGHLVETGLDKYRIDMVFKGKVMGTMDITAADIVSKKLLPPIKHEEKPPQDKESATDEGKDEQPVTVSKGDLRDTFAQARIDARASAKELEGALINLKVRAESTNLEDGIEKSMEIAHEKLKSYLIVYKDLSQVHFQQFAKAGSKDLSLLKDHYKKYLHFIESETLTEIAKSEASRAKIDFVKAWFPNADLDPAPESFAKGDEKLQKQIDRLNDKLDEFAGMRKNRKIDYKKILLFIDHDELFGLYCDSRK